MASPLTARKIRSAASSSRLWLPGTLNVNPLDSSSCGGTVKRLLISQGVLVGFLLGICSLTGVGREDSPRVIDLSLLVSPELPCTAPVGWPYFQINPYLRIG